MLGKHGREFLCNLFKFIIRMCTQEVIHDRSDTVKKRTAILKCEDGIRKRGRFRIGNNRLYLLQLFVNAFVNRGCNMLITNEMKGS